MFEWLKDNVLWVIPAAPLAACLWIVVVGHVIRRKYAHRPLVLGLVISWLASIFLLAVVVPDHFSQKNGHNAEAVQETRTETEEGKDPGHAEHEGQHAAATPPKIKNAVEYTVYQWFKVGTIDIPVTLRADAMSALMLTMVTTVSLLVAIFASSYMTGDPGYPRFFASMALFVFSMCMLVLAGNFLLMFVFWEAVGLCSYLLIGFWFEKPSAAAAAKKAFVVNRIGDFGFILGILFIWQTFGTLDFETLFGSPRAIAELAVTQPEAFHWICLLLLIGAIGKSAQFPLMVWLPDAMEGPTPVSALIHAATMVTAGVYLIARCTPMFVHAPYVQMGVAAIGAATALIAAITALTQYDLKRVLAYSTVSQLGYMFMSLGAAGGGEELAAHATTFAMFHMFTHAFFKAVLFLSAGSVMHAMGNIIDMRQFSGLRKVLPITHWTFLAGALALSGFPLLSGFWSKDEILAVVAAASRNPAHGQFYQVILGIGLLAAFMTAFYTFRAYFMTFWGDEKFPEEAGHHPHDAPPAMAGPLAILAIAALGIGLLTGPTHWYAGYLHHTPGFPHGDELETNWLMMGLSSVLAVGGIALAYLMYVVSPGIAQNLKSSMSVPFKLSQEGLYIDWAGYKFIAAPLRVFATICEFFDRWVIDTLVDCFGFIPGLFGSIIRPIQNGMVQNYGMVMMIGLVVCLVSVLRALAVPM